MASHALADDGSDGGKKLHCQLRFPRSATKKLISIYTKSEIT
jgi:hypothetical protein